MKFDIAALFALAIAPALAVPPPSFGFPEAPNDTVLAAAFKQTTGNIGYVSVDPGILFGIGIPAHRPVIGVNISAYQSLSNYTGDYVVMMVDPDAMYPQNPNLRFYLHWLQANLTQSNNVTVNANLTLDGHRLVNRSAAVVPYARPQPPTNSSAHRYILYAFQQPANFAIPAAWSGLSATNRTNFNLTNFIRDTNLGTPAAANYFYASNESNVPMNFTAAAGGSYPGGNGQAVTSGTVAPSASSTGTSSSHAGAAMVTGMSGLVGAGLIGLAALL